MGRQAERSEATRARLLAAARELFMDRGYAAVGTEEIVREADVTRGALYHHFQGKRDLFRAVYEQTEAELATRIAAELGAGAGPEVDPIAVLRRGLGIFLDICADPRLARIGLVDAPAVLGWEEWRRIGEEHALGIVIGGLELAMQAGRIPRQPVGPLAHLLLGAMGEAGMMIANSDDPPATRREVEPALLSLIGVSAAEG